MTKKDVLSDKFLGDNETMLALEIQIAAKALKNLIKACKKDDAVEDFRHINKKNLAVIVNMMHEDTLQLGRELRVLKKKSRQATETPTPVSEET
jgi:hypothetical protein